MGVEEGIAGREGGFVLLPAKVSAPAPDAFAVVRSRAQARFAGAWKRPLTTVVAPAGFGKTTACAFWAAGAEHPVAWCSLDEDDAEPTRFWSLILAALEGVGVLRGAPFDPLDIAWADGTEAHRAISLLVLALSDGGEPSALVLEDVHEVQDAPLVSEGLGFLVRHLPADMHVVVTSRVPLRLPLAKLRAAGKLGEVTEADLRLTPDEQAALLAAEGVELAPEDARHLDDATQGWPAACRLVGLRCSGGDAFDVASALAGAQESVQEYLFEEVLDALPAELLDFMVATSAVDSFSVALAAALTDLPATEVRTYLDAVIDRGLFIQRMAGVDGDGWYRYHSLLREALLSRLKRLPDDGARLLAIRARSWYLENGYDDAAVGQSYQLRDWDGICDIIQARWKALFMNDDNGTVLRWASLLPSQVLEARPFICAVAAMPSAAAGDEARARELLQKAMLSLRGDEDFLFAFCVSQKALISALAGKRDETIACADKALRFLPEDEDYLRAMMIQVMAGALWRTDPLAAKAGFVEALPLQESLGNRNVLCSALANLSALSADVGQLGEAEHYGRRAEELYDEAARPSKPMLSFVHRARALCAYERGDGEAFEAARAAFEATGSAGSMSARRAELLTIEAKMAYALSERARGQALLAEAAAVDFGGVVAMVPSLVMVRDWCERTRDRAAEFSVAADAGPAERVFDLSIAFVLDNVGRYEEMRDLIDAIDPRYFSLCVRALTFGAAFADKIARRSDALRWLREAYRISEAQGLKVAFLENAPFLQGLVAPLRQPDLASATRDAADAARDAAIAAAIEGACRPAVRAADALTERELDVLRAVADGASVAEAAEALVVSRETVKKHLGNIYTKLGVHSKMAAVALLREEGTL